MSSFDLDTLIDTDNLPDVLNDAMGLGAKLWNSLFKTNKFEGQNVFRAVVISNPKQVLPSEYEALGFSGAGLKSDDGGYSKFKVRIAARGPNPHAMLTDPCDITKTADKCQQNALVAAHTTVVAGKSEGVNIGSFINVRLRIINGMYNLQVADYVSLHAPNETGNDYLDSKLCDAVSLYFKYAESYTPPPTVEISGDIRQDAENYDNTDIPGKLSGQAAGYPPQKTYFTGEFGNGRTLHPIAIPYIKAFIYRAYTAGFFPMTITSGYRSVEQQAALAANNPSGMPTAAPGESRHQSGLAIDINTYAPDGKTFLNSKSDESEWVRSGIVKIAARTGLEWGGTYEDPIHFELIPSEWESNLAQHHDQLQAGVGVNVSTPGITTEEAADLDAASGFSEPSGADSRDKFEVPAEIGRAAFGESATDDVPLDDEDYGESPSGF